LSNVRPISTRPLLVVVLMLLACFWLPATPGFAAEQTVMATSSNAFTPNTVTLTIGDSVLWKNAGGFHNVHFDDGSFIQPSSPDNAAWSVTRAFTAVGSFRYYCEAHGSPGGVGMSGTVVVSTAPPGTVPPAPPQSGIPQSPLFVDRIAPKLALGGPRSQRVRKQRGVTLILKSDEPSTVKARGSVKVPGANKVLRFRSVTTKLAAGIERKVKLPLSRRALRAVRRALRRGFGLIARVTVRAKDSNGNVGTAKRRIKLKA
jgi:plastocyanin